jgi:CubicO group peptidase (beta-lactamase class C family)
MSKRKLICLFLQYMLWAGVSISAQSALLQREIGKIIRHEVYIDFTTVPGVLVGVLDEDSTYVISYGRPFHADAVFELGSVTKPLLAWMVDQALDSLGWDRETLVCSFMPDSLCAMNWKTITIDQLLSHRAGLMKSPSGLGRIETTVQDPYLKYDISLFAKDIKTINPVKGSYSYSHIGYAMLNWLFDRVGGLESFTEKRLIDPLGLSHTGWNMQSDEIEKGHGFDGREKPAWNTNAMMPALGLKSSLNDLLKMIKCISPSLKNDIPELTPSLRKELKTIEKSGAYKVEDGWFLLRSGSYLTYYHNGRTGGHHVSIAFAPQHRKAVVVLSNGAAGSNELSLLVLRMLMRAPKVQFKN